MTKNRTITISTSPSFRVRRFSAPRSPYPWVWRCHKCRIVYRFSALNRCLSCSHRFCQKCVSEFDYSGWEHWKSYWRIGVDKEEEEEEEEEEEHEEEEEGGDGEEGEEEKEEVEKDDDEWETENVKENCKEMGGVLYEDVYIKELEHAAATACLWDGFEDVSSPCTRISLEEQLQLQLSMRLDHSPTSSSPTSPSYTPSPSPTSSEDEDNKEDEWRPSAYYLQRSASVSTLDVDTHGLDLAFKDEHIDPTLRCGYSSVQQARKALYPDCVGSAYGTGEEGETMRDWPAQSTPSYSVQQTGYQSDWEARKVLHLYAATGEEGEPMRDWTSRLNPPGERALDPGGVAEGGSGQSWHCEI